MRILVAYYTQTGNTKRIAQAIHDELTSLGHGVTIENVRKLKAEALAGAAGSDLHSSHPERQ